MTEEKFLDLKKIKEIIGEFFTKTRLVSNVRVAIGDNNTILIEIESEDPKMLIGQNGQILNDMQYLLKNILSHSLMEQINVDLDINDYKKKKYQYLKSLAREAADEVALTKTEKELSPMAPYERRIVHMELSQREDIKTESIGEGFERRIIIKPK
jgi:spoIIIJ-associated protein